jgi:fibronectin type 3 domain-containing protein
MLELPAADWTGQEMLAAIRTRGSGGRLSEWSNSVTFTAQQPLPRPVVRAEADPEGIRVSWQEVLSARYRVRRQDPKDAQPVEVATTERPEFVDRNVSLGLSYTYTVQAQRGQVESVVSEPVAAVATDVFPPAPPTGLIAISGANSVELAWNRNGEHDMGSYRVYRSAGNGPFTVLTDAVEGIAWTDRQVQSGTTYAYQVTAIDKSGNESRPSVPVNANVQ